MLGIFTIAIRVCSTGNFLSSIFSPYLQMGHGSVGLVHGKVCCFMLTNTFLTFFCFVFLSKKKKKCFHNFYFFFWWSNEFPKQNIKQSETAIGDKKLSVELYARKLVHACIANITYVTYLCSPRLAFKINWYWLLFRGGKVKHELWVPIHELRVQIHELRVQIHELRVQIYELRAQIHGSED